MKRKTKKSANDMMPGDIFHPGETIRDELEARDMSQQELADKVKLSKSEISLLLHGHRNITPMIAVLLEKALGIDAEIWMNLQVRHDINRIRKGNKLSGRESAHGDIVINSRSLTKAEEISISNYIRTYKAKAPHRDS